MLHKNIYFYLKIITDMFDVPSKYISLEIITVQKLSIYKTNIKTFPEFLFARDNYNR
jgi:hypothetical protein